MQSNMVPKCVGCRLGLCSSIQLYNPFICFGNDDVMPGIHMVRRIFTHSDASAFFHWSKCIIYSNHLAKPIGDIFIHTSIFLNYSTMTVRLTNNFYLLHLMESLLFSLESKQTMRLAYFFPIFISCILIFTLRLDK